MAQLNDFGPWIPWNGEKIPEISDKTLVERLNSIKPVRRVLNFPPHHGDFHKGAKFTWEDITGELYYIAILSTDLKALKNQPFTQYSRPTTLAKGLTPYKDITTLHEFQHYNFNHFQGTIAEVIAQIPEEDIGVAIAFETSNLKPIRVVDTSKATDLPFMVMLETTTRLYKHI